MESEPVFSSCSQRARGRRGIRSFLGVCLASNDGMVELLRGLDPKARVEMMGAGVAEVTVRLPIAASQHRLATALRGAADQERVRMPAAGR